MQQEVLVLSGCSLQPNFLTLQSMIFKQRNLFVIAGPSINAMTEAPHGWAVTEGTNPFRAGQSVA